jgi:hypothetical protein
MLHHSFRLITVISLLFVLGSCANVTIPKVSGTIQTPFMQGMAEKNETIFLMPPLLSFEQASDESPLPPDQYGGEIVREVMMTEVPNGLSEIGIKCMLADDIPSDQQAVAMDLINNLLEESAVITSIYKDKSYIIPKLQQLKTITNLSSACFQIVKVKIGSGSYYNPYSGEMALGTSSSSIKVYIVSLDDGKILWSNKAIARNQPKSSKFRQAVRMVFSQ